MLLHKFIEFLVGEHCLALQVRVVHGFAGQGLLPEAELLDRVFSGISFSTHDLIHTAVGTGVHHIVLDEDCLALFGADDCG